MRNWMWLMQVVRVVINVPGFVVVPAVPKFIRVFMVIVWSDRRAHIGGYISQV